MTSWFHLENAEKIPSPALLVWPDRVEHNIRHMVDQVGGEPSRLCPHVKTHKLGEVVRLQLEAGISAFKCATIAEVEMAAEAGAPDVLLAYQPVGPNIGRMGALGDRYPDVRFSALVDDSANLRRISDTFTATGKTLPLFVDIDCGMGRSGIAPGDTAFALCREIIDAPGVEFAGLHVYDGHVHDEDRAERQDHYTSAWQTVEPFLSRLETAGIEIPLIVGGGSPTFPFHAEASLRDTRHPYQCSPGTTLLWDVGYGTRHPDLEFQVAAVLLARIFSKPGDNRLCIDLGHKAVAAERPLETRVQFPEIPDAHPVMQSEEHLVVEVPDPDRFAVGDVVYGIPFHICPTVALHQEAVIIRDGRATGEGWKIKARDRRITI